MTQTKRHLLCGLLAAAILSPFVSAAAVTDDSRLEREEQGIDKDASGKTDAARATDLAKQFNVPEATVQDLRSKGQGWGEVTIGLATAQQLAKTEPTTYPTITDALNKVEALRTSGEGWGKIAKDLGFKLGPIVSAAHHARVEKGEHVHGAEHLAHVDHPDRPDHPEHPDHPDHPERPDRPGR